MSFLEAELAQVAELVWDSVLGVRLARRPQAPPAPPRLMAAGVEIHGAWAGAVTIECSAEFARQAAAIMFGVEPAAVTPADSRDALGELANMTGGNLKALLPEPCRLSLPFVSSGPDLPLRPAGGTLLTCVAFECAGGPLSVRLHRAARAAGVAPAG